MRTRVVLLPGALEAEGEQPLFESVPPALAKLMERGKLMRVSVGEGLEELAWLGLDPHAFELSEGVLIVSALGADPPDRSVHFHLSLLSTDGEAVSQPEFLPSEEDLACILHQARKLETSRLKLVEGRGFDHGLVWEDGSIELRCSEPREAVEGGLRSSLPEGDGEIILRRFIDDSINILSELELNEIRLEEGLQPFNLLWPWGAGFRPKLPNLTVERGTSVRVESPSVRLAGLSRLVGYRHADPWSLGSGTNLKLESVSASMLAAPYSVAVMPTLGEFRSDGKFEELEWLSRELAGRLLEPIAAEAAEEPRRVLFGAWSRKGKGLLLDFRSDGPVEGTQLPFDAEVAEERGLPSTSLHPKIAEVLTAR